LQGQTLWNAFAIGLPHWLAASRNLSFGNWQLKTQFLEDRNEK